MAQPQIAYILKMYPRFSETFILNEVLELERQGMRLQIFSLKKPDDGRFHADVSRVQANTTYLPESPLLAPRAFYEAHRQVFAWNRGHYLRLLLDVLKRRRFGALKRFLQAGYIAPRLHQQGITHVHAHFATSATSVALYLHRLGGFSYSFTAHAKDIYLESVSTDVLHRKLAAARFTITVSDYNRTHLLSLGASDRVVRIYNGLDLRQFSPHEVAPDDPPLVLGVGRLVEKKGFADLIRACAILRREGCRFQCRIVGKGELERPLRALIDELDLAAQVELSGPMPREVLLDLYPRASVVTAPCIVGADGNRDGLPTVLIEAMALGVPVVSTDVTGIPELVEDGRTGLLVAQHDPQALAGAIRLLLEDRAAAGALARAGRERVEAMFDLRENIAQLRALFDQAGAACE